MATNPYQYDVTQLAVGILYLNLGRAGVEFPTTTRAHPSEKVQVTLIPPLSLLDPTHKVLFPFFVGWDIWKNVVGPLFEDGSVLVKILGGEGSGSLRNEIQRSHLLTGDIKPLLDKIEQGLIYRLTELNYIPVGATDEGFVAPLPAPGEPVLQPGTNDGSPFTRFDT